MSHSAPTPPIRRRRRWILAVFALLSTSPWWLPNLPWSRQWVARRIASKTGLSCEIGRLWLITGDGQPRAENIRLSSPVEPNRGRTEFTLPVVRISPDWAALRHGRLALAELLVDGGEAVWQPGRRSIEPDPVIDPTIDPTPALLALASNQPDPPASAGLVPLAGPDEPTTTPTPATPATPATVAAAAPQTTRKPQAQSPDLPPTRPTPTPQTAPATPPPSGLPARLRQLTIRNLHLRLLAPAAAPHPLASARLDASLPLGHPGAGHLTAQSVVLLGDRVWPHPVHLPVISDGQTLSAAEVPFDSPGGRLNISLRCEPGARGAPMVGEVAFGSVSLPGLFAWAAPRLAAAQGRLEGKVQVAGFVRHPRSFRSVGQLQVGGLVVPAHAWLRDAGLEAWAARVPQPDVTGGLGRLVFRSAGSRMVIDDASLMAAEATIRAVGTVSPAAGLNFSGRAYLASGGVDWANQVTADWPLDRRLDFTLLPNSPWAYLDSWMQGPLDDPEVVLWGRSWTLPQLRQEVVRLNAARSPPSG